MSQETVVQLFGATQATKNGPLKGLMRRLGSARIRRSTSRPGPTNHDPYLLVLLADQELVAGREEQARYLVEAAYDFFDQKAQSNVYKLNLAG